jgi:hypothetical protein
VEFSYSVEWVEEATSKYEDRMLRYVDSRFIPSTFEVSGDALVHFVCLRQDTLT